MHDARITLQTCVISPVSRCPKKHKNVKPYRAVHVETVKENDSTFLFLHPVMQKQGHIFRTYTEIARIILGIRHITFYST